MGGSGACTSQITQQLKKLNLGEAKKNVEHELSLKNDLESNFSTSAKVKFSPPKHANCMIFDVTIPMQLTKSNFEAQKLQNDYQIFLA